MSDDQPVEIIKIMVTVEAAIQGEGHKSLAPTAPMDALIRP